MFHFYSLLISTFMNKCILAFYFILLCIFSHQMLLATDLPKDGRITESQTISAPEIAQAIKAISYTSEDHLQMEISCKETMHIVITTLLGQTIVNKRIEPSMTSTEFIIPMSRYQAGTYYITIKGKDGSHRYTLQTSHPSSGP